MCCSCCRSLRQPPHLLYRCWCFSSFLADWHEYLQTLCAADVFGHTLHVPLKPLLYHVSMVHRFCVWKGERKEKERVPTQGRGSLERFLLLRHKLKSIGTLVALCSVSGSLRRCYRVRVKGHAVKGHSLKQLCPKSLSPPPHLSLPPLLSLPPDQFFVPRGTHLSTMETTSNTTVQQTVTVDTTPPPSPSKVTAVCSSPKSPHDLGQKKVNMPKSFNL
jgi:hypothetical protein